LLNNEYVKKELEILWRQWLWLVLDQN
jgi:hypothetical protein